MAALRPSAAFSLQIPVQRWHAGPPPSQRKLAQRRCCLLLVVAPMLSSFAVPLASGFVRPPMPNSITSAYRDSSSCRPTAMASVADVDIAEEGASSPPLLPQRHCPVPTSERLRRARLRGGGGRGNAPSGMSYALHLALLCTAMEMARMEAQPTFGSKFASMSLQGLSGQGVSS